MRRDSAFVKTEALNTSMDAFFTEERIGEIVDEVYSTSFDVISDEIISTLSLLLDKEAITNDDMVRALTDLGAKNILLN